MIKWWNWVLGASLLLLLFVAIPLIYNGQDNNEQLKSIFDKYVEKFNKTYKYDPAEYEMRFNNFVESLKEINKLNLETRGPDEYKAKYGLTKLSDMSKLEYKEIHLSDERLQKPPSMYRKSLRKFKESKNSETYGFNDHGNHHRNEAHTVNLVRKKRASIPLKLNWCEKGFVGPIRNQGLCGACWAFSTIGVMETMAAIKTGKMETLSVQEVVDCARQGNSGCAGGDICLLLEWLVNTDTAVVTEKEYPLKLADGACKVKKNTTGVRVNTFTCNDFVGAEDKIIEAIATHGPVAVAVNGLSWQNYLGGVIQYHCSGSSLDLNHAVQLVGYDLSAVVPHYIAKNSWGPEFGEGGYLYLAIGSNVCGLANEVAAIDVTP